MSDDGPVFRVTSVNQHGGITAGQVNVGRPPRALDAGNRAQLKQTLRKETKVVVTAVMGDGEALQFAHEIKAFLESEGYEVEGVNQAVYTAPVMGQSVVDHDDRFEIIIGNRP